MKTITAREDEWIADVISEGLTPSVEAILEKDLLLTQALLSSLRAKRGNPGLQ
jgi:hypothetical protein